jgi:hypothetical protein
VTRNSFWGQKWWGQQLWLLFPRRTQVRPTQSGLPAVRFLHYVTQ